MKAVQLILLESQVVMYEKVLLPTYFKHVTTAYSLIMLRFLKYCPRFPDSSTESKAPSLFLSLNSGYYIRSVIGLDFGLTIYC